MGALTSNRKRGGDYLNVNLKSPVSYSPFSELHTSKKPKLFRAFDEVADRTRPIRAFSKFFSYPAFKSELKREPHAPVRRQRVGNSVNFKKIDSEVSSAVEHSAQHMGNYFSRNYENAREAALGTFRYTRDDKTYEVDEVAEDVVSEDSSIEEVEILGDEVHEKNQERDGILEDPHKFDGMIEEGDSRPSNSPPGINSTDRKSNVGSPEKLLESLHLGGEYDVMDARVYQKLLYASGMRDGKLNSLQFEIELKEKELQRQQLLRPQKKEVIKKDVAYEAFKPLTEEEEAEVTHAISNSSRRKILVTHESSNISITGELLQCLRPGAWLNDEVINLYLELLKEREKREPEKFLKCHFFNTFFYKKLINGRGGYNYQSVRRWTSQRKLGYCIYDCDKIFVPIHKEVHWCLAVINIKEKKFQYLDSLNGGDNHVMKAMSRYLMDEVKDKNGKEIDVSSWEREFVEDLPQQHNGFDCGVFMIKYADFYSRDIGLCFGQENMPYFRRRTAKEILKLKAE